MSYSEYPPTSDNSCSSFISSVATCHSRDLTFQTENGAVDCASYCESLRLSHRMNMEAICLYLPEVVNINDIEYPVITYVLTTGLPEVRGVFDNRAIVYFASKKEMMNTFSKSLIFLERIAYEINRRQYIIQADGYFVSMLKEDFKLDPMILSGYPALTELVASDRFAVEQVNDTVDTSNSVIYSFIETLNATYKYIVLLQIAGNDRMIVELQTEGFGNDTTHSVFFSAPNLDSRKWYRKGATLGAIFDLNSGNLISGAYDRFVNQRNKHHPNGTLTPFGYHAQPKGEYGGHDAYIGLPIDYTQYPSEVDYYGQMHQPAARFP